MIVQVDPGSPVPVFEELRAQIERLIASGQLAVGDSLPPIRQPAADLGLARGTVNKVYEALARDELVETAGRNGTTVRRRASRSVACSASVVRPGGWVHCAVHPPSTGRTVPVTIPADGEAR